MSVPERSIVYLNYKLFEVDKENRRVLVERTEENVSLSFLLDTGSLLPAIENKLKTLNEGDSFDFFIPAEEAYGSYDPDLLVWVSVDNFKNERGERKDDVLYVGNRIPMNSDDGYFLLGTITEVKSDLVQLDYNHPLAGKNLLFTGKLMRVRNATYDELLRNLVLED